MNLILNVTLNVILNVRNRKHCNIKSKSVNYRCILRGIGKNKAVSILNNSVLEDKGVVALNNSVLEDRNVL